MRLSCLIRHQIKKKKKIANIELCESVQRKLNFKTFTLRSIKKYRIFLVTKYSSDSFKQGKYQTMTYPGKKYKLQVPMKKDCLILQSRHENLQVAYHGLNDFHKMVQPSN